MMSKETTAMVEIIRECTTGGRPLVDAIRESMPRDASIEELAIVMQVGLLRKAAEGVDKAGCPFCTQGAMMLFEGTDWTEVAMAVMAKHEWN